MKDEASRREKPNEIGFAWRRVGFMYQAAAAATTTTRRPRRETWWFAEKKESRSRVLLESVCPAFDSLPPTTLIIATSRLH